MVLIKGVCVGYEMSFCENILYIFWCCFGWFIGK